MKKAKQKSLILFSIIMVLVSIFFAYTAKADSGFDSSWDSGGSSWGSDSSWGGGSSWDYPDYGGSSHSIGGSYSGNPFGVAIGVIIIVAFVVFLISACKPPAMKIVSSKATYKEMPDEEINAAIPNFNKSEFYQKAFEIYKSVQDAWMNFDEKKLRDLVTDEMYNMYVMQMDTMKIKNEKNIMNDFVMTEARVIRITNDNGVISIQLFMNVEMHDYLIDTVTGKVKRGSSDRLIDIDYVMTFVKSASKGDKKGTIKCPNCGASVKLKSSGKCEYCDSTIVINANDYVMSKKENVGQRLL